jgi:hypothetical protein
VLVAVVATVQVALKKQFARSPFCPELDLCCRVLNLQALAPLPRVMPKRLSLVAEILDLVERSGLKQKLKRTLKENDLSRRMVGIFGNR